MSQFTDEKFDHFLNTQQLCGFHTDWSLYEVDDLNTKHPFPQGCEVVYLKGEHWGDHDQIVPVEGDTWVDLWRAADQAILGSGDSHHCFIEEFTLTNGNQLVLRTGS